MTGIYVLSASLLSSFGVWYYIGSDNYNQRSLGAQGGIQRSTIPTFSALNLFKNITKISCGQNHTMILSGTKLYGFGLNYYSQLGLPYKTVVDEPVLLDGNWSDVICGYNRTYALSANTNIWFGTGYGSPYLFGTQNYSVVLSSFNPIPGFWANISVGQNHTFALSAGTQDWYATGSNSNGQCGIIGGGSSITWNKVPGNFSKLLAGSSSSIALSVNGRVCTAGVSLYTGSPNFKTDSSTFSAISGIFSDIAISDSGSFALSANTDIWFGTGYNVPSYTTFRGNFSRISFKWQKFIVNNCLTNISIGNMATGVFSNCFYMQSAGSVNNAWYGYDTYSNSVNRLGDKSIPAGDNFTLLPSLSINDVAIGSTHVIAISTDGSVISTGRNDFGAAGHKRSLSRTAAIKPYPLSGFWKNIYPTTDGCVAISANSNKAFYVGSAGFNNASTWTPLTGDWSYFSASPQVIVGLSANTNKWFIRGNNLYRQLGGNYTLTDTTTYNSFVELSGNWSYVTAANDNRVIALSANTYKWFAVGSVSFGEYGTPDTNFTSSGYTPLTGEWEMVFPSVFSSYALSANTNKLFAAGQQNAYSFGIGEDNDNKSSFINIPGNWSFPVRGQMQTVVLSANGKDWFASGFNGGQFSLGLNDNYYANILSAYRINGNFSNISLLAESPFNQCTGIVGLSGNKVFIAPSAPTITSILSGLRSLTVNFTEPNPGSTPIYRYEYSVNYGNWYTWAPVSPCIIGGLADSTLYNVRMRAVSLGGKSVESVAVSGGTFSIPGAPIINSVTSGLSSISAYFTPPSNTGGIPLIGYYYSLSSSVFGLFVGSAYFGTSPITQFISPEYEKVLFRLNAYNAVGLSPTVSASPVTIFGNASQPIINSVTIHPSQPNTVTVDYSVPTTLGGGTLSAYQYWDNINNRWVTV